MIKETKFTEIKTGVEKAVKEAFRKAKEQQKNNDFILFLAMANYYEPNVIINKNPHVIDYRISRIHDESRLNILLEYIQKNYSFHKTNTTDDGLSITFELMIYTHMWESKPYLGQLKRLAALVKGDDYIWQVIVPEFGKRKYINEDIINVFKGKDLSVNNVMTKGYNAQLRNAFAHSDHYVNTNETSIELLNYKHKDWEMESIEFDAWTERFCYTFLLGYHMHKVFHEERQSLSSSPYKVKLMNEKGDQIDGEIYYNMNLDSFSATVIDEKANSKKKQ